MEIVLLPERASQFKFLPENFGTRQEPKPSQMGFMGIDWSE